MPKINTRRVVTGVDANGKAIISYDDTIARYTGEHGLVDSALIWTTDGYPIDYKDSRDMADRTVPRGPEEHCTTFRIVDFHPGNSRDMHITQSIDYAVVMSGEIDMEVDDGVKVHLKAGDVLVQRQTIHNWENRGTEPCRIAFILIETGMK